MRFRIRHVTVYRYERPVILGSHVFRMEPHGEGLRLDAFKIITWPPPAMISPGFDGEGNPVHTAVYEGETSEFRVSVVSEGESLDPAPPTGSFALPPFYGDDIQTLWKYRVVEGGAGATAVEEGAAGALNAAGLHQDDVAAFARAVAMDAGGDALAFLRGLSRALCGRVRNVSRLIGDPFPADVTLREGRGSCRDFAVLFAACCRHQGLAARFVSGYIPAPLGESQHMHAWAEVHLPGHGWTAWDPTQGGAANAAHVRVAAAAEPADAAPLSGGYRSPGGFPGEPVESEMSVELSVETE